MGQVGCEIGGVSAERDFTGNRALKIGKKVGEIKLYIWIHHLEIRKKVGEIKLYIWIHQQIAVEVKVVDTVTYRRRM